MTYVVTENCKGCKYTLCTVVCPVEAFREGPDMVYIDPDLCLNCDACMIECPVEAIYPDFDVPERFRHYIKLNETNAKIYPVINTLKDPLDPEGCKKR